MFFRSLISTFAETFILKNKNYEIFYENNAGSSITGAVFHKGECSR